MLQFTRFSRGKSGLLILVRVKDLTFSNTTQPVKSKNELPSSPCLRHIKTRIHIHFDLKFMPEPNTPLDQ